MRAHNLQASASTKVAWIAGATGVVGAEVCRRLSRNCANVVIHYYSNEPLARELASDAKRQGVDAVTLKGDIASSEQVLQIANDLRARFGRVDYLINCSGIIRDKMLVFMSEEDWNDVLDVNLKGVFLCNREAVKIMVRQVDGGRIVNMSSGVGISGNIGQCNYAAAKAGIVAFTKSIAQEYSKRQILANCITTGAVKGGMAESLQADVALDEREDTLDPGYVAGIIVDLILDRFGLITGQNLIVEKNAVYKDNRENADNEDQIQLQNSQAG